MLVIPIVVDKNNKQFSDFKVNILVVNHLSSK